MLNAKTETSCGIEVFAVKQMTMMMIVLQFRLIFHLFAFCLTTAHGHRKLTQTLMFLDRSSLLQATVFPDHHQSIQLLHIWVFLLLQITQRISV